MLYIVKRGITRLMGSKKLINIGFRIDPDENERLDELVERVRERNPYMDKSKVIRELIGFDRARFVKDEDRKILSGATVPGRSTPQGDRPSSKSEARKGTKAEAKVQPRSRK